MVVSEWVSSEQFKSSDSKTSGLYSQWKSVHMLSKLISTVLSWSKEYHYHCTRYINSVDTCTELFVSKFNPGTAVSGVTVNEGSIFALKETKNIDISCAITLNNTIGPDYSALNVTWTHNGSQSTMLQSTPSRMGGMLSAMFTSVLTIDSNEFSDSGSYCCVAAVIGSGISNKNCVTLNVLGKLKTVLH